MVIKKRDVLRGVDSAIWKTNSKNGTALFDLFMFGSFIYISIYTRRTASVRVYDWVIG